MSATGPETALPGLPSFRRLAQVVALSFAPSLLVMLDRWVVPIEVAEPLGCRWNLFCAGHRPLYLLLILPLAALTIATVARWPGEAILSDPGRNPRAPTFRRMPRSMASLAWLLRILGGGAMLAAIIHGQLVRQTPGWAYAIGYSMFLCGWLVSGGSLPWPRGWSLRDSAETVAAMLAIGAAVAGARASSLHPTGGTALILGAALLSFGMCLRWRRIRLPGLWLSTLALCTYSLFLTAWWFVAIGDEFSFYNIASQLAAHFDLATIGNALYEAQGVYGSHPQFSSLLQALSLQLWGDTLFGWRFGGLCLTALSLTLLFPFYRTLGGRAFAVYALFLLAASPYLMSFVKIGYNNLQAFFTLALALAAATWAIHTPTVGAYALAGAAVGLGFYVYPGALLTLPVPLLLLGMLGSTAVRGSWRRWAVLALVLLATALPMVVQPEFWVTKIGGLWLNQPVLRDAPSAALRHMTGNLVDAALAPLWLADESHFVAVGYLDPLAAGLGLIGAGVLLRRGEPRRTARYLLTSFGLLVLLAGVLHDRPFPPATRMFVILPLLVTFPALGMAWILSTLRDLGWRRRQVQWTEALILIGILALALVQAYPLSRVRMAPRYQSFQVLLLREARRLFEAGPEEARLVIVTQPERPLQASIEQMLRLNEIPIRPGQLREVSASAPHGQLTHDPSALVLVAPWVPEAEQAELESALQASGRSPCRFRDSLGEVRLLLWAPPEWKGFCQQANLQVR